MRRSLFSIIAGWERIGSRRLSVVFIGKVKPVELTLVEPLEDGLYAIGPGTAGPALYPYSAFASIDLAPSHSTT